MRVQNMTSPRGNKVPNQFTISEGDTVWFQSYGSVIAKKQGYGDNEVITLDEHYWDYSVTTGKYRNQFLGESIEATRHKIASGEYKLANLN